MGRSRRQILGALLVCFVLAFLSAPIGVASQWIDSIAQTASAPGTEPKGAIEDSKVEAAIDVAPSPGTLVAPPNRIEPRVEIGAIRATRVVITRDIYLDQRALLC